MKDARLEPAGYNTGMGDRRRQCKCFVLHADSLTLVSQQFAIRTTIRNHHVLKRDDVISQVAAAVGEKHSVDLKNYDQLIVVEIYQVRRVRYMEWRPMPILLLLLAIAVAIVNYLAK